jgi:hypothetical protein
VNAQEVWAEGGAQALVDAVAHEGVVKTLLAAGADVKAVSWIGSALHMVAVIADREHALRPPRCNNKLTVANSPLR